MLPRTVLLLIFYLECQKDVHGKESVVASEQVCAARTIKISLTLVSLNA